MSEELPERLESILGDEAVWLEPPAQLEERVRSLAGPAPATISAHRMWTWIPAAAAAVVLVVAGLVALDRPDWEIDLSATEEAAGATALVRGWNQPGSTRLEIHIEGLPAAAPGSYYEIWLTSPDGLHVSGGTFNGDGVVTAAVGVRRRDFPRIWITYEMLDDDPSPSPRTYFDSSQ